MWMLCKAKEYICSLFHLTVITTVSSQWRLLVLLYFFSPLQRSALDNIPLVFRIPIFSFQVLLTDDAPFWWLNVSPYMFMWCSFFKMLTVRYYTCLFYLSVHICVYKHTQTHVPQHKWWQKNLRWQFSTLTFVWVGPSVVDQWPIIFWIVCSSHHRNVLITNRYYCIWIYTTVLL